MSYKALVRSNVRKAFNLVKDLAEDVVFVKKLASTFNFTSMEAKTTSSESIVTKAIITESNKKSEEHNAMNKTVMLKTQDIGDINAYDTIVRNNENWKIGAVIYTDGFVTIADIHKEVAA
jgi:cyanate lyase